MVKETPVVSIVCVAFNHEKFIRKAVEGFLAQRTTFPIEVILHDDASSDGTADIIREYAAKHPDLIVPVLQTENQFSKGNKPWWICFKMARGRYIAICEGDDYWTDPLKLQKQVDLMESDPELAICYHRAHTLKDGTLDPFPVPGDVDLMNMRFDDLLRTYNFVITATTLFRRSLMPFPEWFARSPFGDLALHAHAGSKGRMAMLPESMAVWRVTGSGAWTGRSQAQQDRGFLWFYRVARPHLTPAQRELVDRKRAMLLDREAAERYPVNPRRKRIYLTWLRMRELWHDARELRHREH